MHKHHSPPVHIDARELYQQWSGQMAHEHNTNLHRCTSQSPANFTRTGNPRITVAQTALHVMQVATDFLEAERILPDCRDRRNQNHLRNRASHWSGKSWSAALGTGVLHKQRDIDVQHKNEDDNHRHPSGDRPDAYPISVTVTSLTETVQRAVFANVSNHAAGNHGFDIESYKWGRSQPFAVSKFPQHKLLLRVNEQMEQYWTGSLLPHNL